MPTSCPKVVNNGVSGKKIVKKQQKQQQSVQKRSCKKIYKNEKIFKELTCMMINITYRMHNNNNQPSEL